MLRRKSKKHTVEVTFKIKAITRDDVDIITLLKKETEYLAEPMSANGCVTSMVLKEIK